MALRKRERLDPDIPGTSKPALCRRTFEDGSKCNAPSHKWIESTIEVLNKPVPVKIPVCDEHFAEIEKEKADASS